MMKPSGLEALLGGGLKAAAKGKNTPVDAIDRELLKRPSFSFRLQLVLGFLLLFFLSLAIIIGSMIAINRIQKKLYFVQASERFLFEVEQARRWEKEPGWAFLFLTGS